MKDTKFNYFSPQMSVVVLCAENGFAASTEAQWYRNETNSANIGWSYSADDESWE